MNEDYYVLIEKDIINENDEMQSPVTGIWSKVPKSWIGLSVSYNENNTFSRMKVKIRRKK